MCVEPSTASELISELTPILHTTEAFPTDAREKINRGVACGVNIIGGRLWTEVSSARLWLASGLIPLSTEPLQELGVNLQTR